MSPLRLVLRDQRTPTWPDPAGILPPGGRPVPCSHQQRDAECKLAAAALSQGSISPPSPLASYQTQQSLLQKHLLEGKEYHPPVTQDVTLPLGLYLPQYVSPTTDKVHLDSPHMLKKEEGKKPTAETFSAVLEGKGLHRASCPAPTAHGSLSPVCSCSYRCCRHLWVRGR